MKRAFWLGAWVGAVAALSQLIAAGKSWRTAMSGWFVLETLVWLAILVVTVGLLMLKSYALERRRGRVVNRIALFERLLERGGDGE
ncbi:MAG: hypothetical protein HUU35_05920 [Armatimonadetes bacterium]|nr:hypothetical protein [Armatimonadota bacterium]